MLIIPFVYFHVTIQSMLIHRYKVLTIGGSLLWTEMDHLDLQKDILEPNGIVLKSDPFVIENKIVLCEVDTEKTDMNDFYLWDEIGVTNTDTFCWRNLYTIGTQENEQDWLSIPCIEHIGPYSCKEICSMILEHQSHLNDKNV
jgi:hypothetical protein